MSDSFPTPPTVPPSPQKPKFKKNKEVTSSFWENAECKRRNGRISDSGKENTEGDKEKTTTIVSSQNYTACLSEVFPSFAGVATREEYRKAFWSSLLFAILILITLILINQFSNNVLVAVSTILLLAFTIMLQLDNIRVFAKRFHAFGWSYTYCNLFPSIMLGLIGFYFFICGFAEKDKQYLIIGREITPILNTIYFLIIRGVCFFGNAHIDTCGNSNDDKINKYKNLPIRCAYVLLPLCVLGSVVFFELPCIKPSIQQNKAEIKLRRLGYEDSYESHRIEEKDNDDIMKLKIAARWISPSEAFHKAVSDNNVELMKFLIEKGADVNNADKDGESPLHKAAVEGHTEVVKLLIDAGADVNKANEVGWTPLHKAAGYGHTEVVKLLIDAGAVDKDVNKADAYDATLLYHAAADGRTEAVKLLIEAGADVNKAAKDGKTPLYWAAWGGHKEMVRLLIAKGADVNKAAKDGWTPLHWAAWRGHKEMVRLLIAKGADVNKANEVGRTPLHWASENGHTEIVELLKAAGARK